jgi:hypothetical protein
MNARPEKKLKELEQELEQLYEELAEAEQQDDVIGVIGLRREIQEVERELGLHP